MAASAVLNNSEAKNSSAGTSRDSAVPSGFILKLYQMCHGAPDDVISVSAFFLFRGRAMSGPCVRYCCSWVSKEHAFGVMEWIDMRLVDVMGTRSVLRRHCWHEVPRPQLFFASKALTFLRLACQHWSSECASDVTLVSDKWEKMEQWKSTYSLSSFMCPLPAASK